MKQKISSKVYEEYLANRPIPREPFSKGISKSEEVRREQARARAAQDKELQDHLRALRNYDNKPANKR
jgi:hypothetical protein